jgi:predicted dehydrogenase/nucleoside-diphosphate-sugar epimerase
MGVQHLKAIATLPEAIVVGVADPRADPEMLEGHLASGVPITASTGELLQAVRPDVVHVVTPPGTHAALAAEAIRAGCHVYIEKPFTPTRQEAQDLLELARLHNVSVCAGHQYLFERPALLAMEALPEIGRLVHVESFFSFRTVRRTIAPVDQAKDILPHAVYPLVAQLRTATGILDGELELRGLDVTANGDVYALVHLGESTGVLVVTLSGRPVEQYQEIIGTKGRLRADYVTGSLMRLLGPGAGVGVLLTPFRRASQTLWGATTGVFRLAFGRRTSYPGLQMLIGRFYEGIRRGGPPVLTPQSILDTVGICAQIGEALDEVAEAESRAAQRQLADAELLLSPATGGLVVVTGGTGLLGRRVAEELRHAHFRVRVVARRLPRWAARLPGVEYVVADLADALPPEVLSGASTLVHCAAETAGGRDEQRRNSIEATRNVIEAAAHAGVHSVVHVSSLAVLKPGRGGGGLSEESPVDTGNPERGPYVWGKAESEALAQRLGQQLGLAVKIVRPGPLVDYASFQPPGRLGRELGPWFVAIGGKQSPLSVCDVGTAARVIRWYAQDFVEAPQMLNLIEAPPPVRRELVGRLRQERPDLSVLWCPGIILRATSPLLKVLQRWLLGSKKPSDVYAAFASERYKTDLAANVIQRAGASAVLATNDRVSEKM